MIVRSNHYLDVHNWILSVIESCKNLEQLNGALVLSDLYWKKYCKNDDSEKSNIFNDKLFDQIKLLHSKIKDKSKTF